MKPFEAYLLAKWCAQPDLRVMEPKDYVKRYEWALPGRRAGLRRKVRV